MTIPKILPFRISQYVGPAVNRQPGNRGGGLGEKDLFEGRSFLKIELFFLVFFSKKI